MTLLALLLPVHQAIAQIAPVPLNARAAIDALVGATAAAPGPLGADASILATSQTPPANAAEISFTLASVTLIGGTVYAPGTLDALFTERIGTTITVLDLFEIAAILQARYRDDGYLFTRVLVPAQAIDGGNVTLDLLEAVIEEVRIEEPAAPLGPVRALAERIVAPLRGMRNPRLADIESALLRLNDIPGIVRAAAVPKLGADVRGGVKLFVNMEREALEIVGFADNRQSPLIGAGLYGAVASWNSWSAAGDSTTLSVFGSGDFDDAFPRDFKERWTGQIEHGRFIGAQGLSLSTRALYSRTRPGDVVAAFGIRGQQLELEAGLRWPLLRARALSANLTGGFMITELDTELPGAGGAGKLTTANDSLRTVFFGANMLQRDLYGVTEAAGSIRIGIDAFGASRPGDAGLSRADGDGSYVLLRAQASRTLTHPELLGPISLWGEVRGQWADRPLLSSEEFGIGGPILSRAYDPSEFSGDNGIGVTGELRYALDFTLGGHLIPTTFYGYADAAEISNLDDGRPSHQSLVSAGGGLRASMPFGMAINLEAAKPIDTPLARNSSDAWRFFFSASKRF
jgi:hemolysin activation/secretion protein